MKSHHFILLLTLFALTMPMMAAESGDGSQPAAVQRGPRQGLAPLPKAVASFGAAVSGEWLYVYSGHVGGEHEHSTENLAKGFWRMNVAQRGEWETLPPKGGLQGLALVAHDGYLYRIGGLSARNAPDEPEDLHSLNDVLRYDPRSAQWQAMTPLPEARSSHDAMVLGDKLYVAGGWTLAGDSDEGQWAKHLLVADLKHQPLVWEKVDQPFQHRALALAATGNRLYAIGGLTRSDGPTSATWIYNRDQSRWSRGPDLPTNTRIAGFAVSAFGVGDTVWASGIDSRVYYLKESGDRWVDTGYDLQNRRFFHRLLPFGDEQLLFIGGANRVGQLDDIETVEIATLTAIPAAQLPDGAAADAPARSSSAGSKVWPGFRGRGDSLTQARDLPVTWTEDTAKWTASLRGYGQSSPVVWNDRVFVTSIEGDMQQTLHVAAYELESGRELWHETFDATQKVKNTGYVSKAAPTPAVDGRGVYIFFESGDLLAVDHEGQLLWQRALTEEYGPFEGNHGIGSSIAQTSDSIILLADHSGDSYLLSIDKATGKNRWQVDREPRVSWSSPTVFDTEAGPRIAISSNGVLQLYDAGDGRRLWEIDGIEKNTVASPTVGSGYIVAGSSERRQTVAVHVDGATSPIAWRADRATSNFGSPLIAGNRVYVVNKAGVLWALDLKTGEEAWTLRLPSSCWASPIAAGDLLYFFGTDGQTVVLRDAGDEPQKVAQSELPTESRIYGVAAVDGRLLIRTGSKLMCFMK